MTKKQQPLLCLNCDKPMSPTFWDLVPSPFWTVGFECRSCYAAHDVRWSMSILACFASWSAACLATFMITSTGPSPPAWMFAAAFLITFAAVWLLFRDFLLSHLSLSSPVLERRRKRHLRYRRKR